MCDTFYQKCQCCERRVSVHIADHCTSRENIEVWCHEHFAASTNSDRRWIRFTESIETRSQVLLDGVPCGAQGKLVAFLVKDLSAWGIGLN